MDRDTISAGIAEVRQLLADRMHVRGRTLSRQVRRAGRRLPRAARQAGHFLGQAEGLLAHPKLARMIDPAEAARALATLRAHLDRVDPAAERITRIVNLAALIGAQLLTVGALVVAVLWWRGLI